MEKLGSETALFEKVMGMMTHAQAHYCHESLGSKIQLRMQDDGFNYVENTKRKKKNWASRDRWLGKVSKLSQEFQTTADINIFLGWHGPMSTSWFTGIAWIGQVCEPKENNSNDYYKCQLTFLWENSEGTELLSDAWHGEVSTYLKATCMQRFDFSN